MKSLSILIIFTVALSGKSISDNDPDYKPRLLLKELNNLSRGEDLYLHELKLSDSIVNISRINGKFYEAVSLKEKKFMVYVGRVTCCRAGGCSNPLTEVNYTDFEYFDYFILFDLQGRIISVRVYNYAATHGQEITAKGWLNQFLGYDGNKNLHVGKEIDSISGATISVNGILADIQEKIAMLKTIIMTK